jgi:glutaredoxin
MKKTILFLFVIAAAFLAACSGNGGASYYIPSTEASPAVQNLAMCLTENEAIMYGTEWCPHCKNQKELFGSAFADIMYVNCEANPSACNAAGVQGFPTWVINGQRYSGTRQLAELAEYSGCSLAQ